MPEVASASKLRRFSVRTASNCYCLTAPQKALRPPGSLLREAVSPLLDSGNDRRQSGRRAESPTLRPSQRCCSRRCAERALRQPTSACVQARSPARSEVPLCESTPPMRRRPSYSDIESLRRRPSANDLVLNWGGPRRACRSSSSGTPLQRTERASALAHEPCWARPRRVARVSARSYSGSSRTSIGARPSRSARFL